MTLPNEGVPCVCDAREGLHMHAGDEVFGLVMDSRVPRGTMLIGPPEHLAMLSFDDDLASAWGLSEQEKT